MKKIALLTALSVLLVTTFSCSKDENCKFENSTFIGKWKLTKLTENGVDVTTTFFSTQPCQKTLVIEFKSNNSVSQSNVSGCSTENDRSWKTISINGKNFFVLFDSNDSDTTEISSFSCNSFTTVDGTTSYTATKQ